MEGEKQPTLSWPKLFSPLTGVLVKKPQRGDTMIMSIPVDIKRLVELKRDYPWSKPDHCTNCKNPNLWGHGFVDAFFDCEKVALPLKRYRCPNCGKVIKLKPQGYFNRFHATIDTIRKSITSLATTGKYIPGVSYSVNIAGLPH